jgi:hypothetical protein
MQQYGAILEIRLRPSTDATPVSTLTLDFSASRMVRNKFLLSINYSVCDSLLHQDELTKEDPKKSFNVSQKVICIRILSSSRDLGLSLGSL